MFTNLRSAVADFISPELAHERRSLERLVNIDSLSGVANRRAFDLAIATAELDDFTAIVLFDANNFGKLNKIAGQRFGDVAIKSIADCIQRQAEAFGVKDRVFRIGGDEFVVLCPAAIADRLRDQIENAFGVKYPGVALSLTGTVGSTYAAADDQLQGRKAARKAR